MSCELATELQEWITEIDNAIKVLILNFMNISLSSFFFIFYFDFLFILC
jgi:hypothetical protein